MDIQLFITVLVLVRLLMILLVSISSVLGPSLMSKNGSDYSNLLEKVDVFASWL